MKLLLDTHILIWYLDGHPNLSEKHRSIIEDRRNLVAVSSASLWEMTIKISVHRHIHFDFYQAKLISNLPQ